MYLHLCVYLPRHVSHVHGSARLLQTAILSKALDPGSQHSICMHPNAGGQG